MRDSNSTWQKNLAQGFSSAAELLSFLQLPTSLANNLAEKTFKTRVPRNFAARMQPGNQFDPLLLQVLAVSEELERADGFIADPLAEAVVNPVPGLIHKYSSRVLLTVTGVCAVNCRYCFRRDFPYEDNNPGINGWQHALDYIAKDSRIHEVILSGGDPLLAKDNVLAALFNQLATIPHVHTLRIHSRIPIVLPERVNESFIDLLKTSPLHKVIVLHCNHPQEIDSQVADACAALRLAGCHLLNQSVLLSGVNDSVDILTRLSERLFACGVLPYYLHLLDKVQGTAHFDVALDKASNIFRQLQSKLPGYLVPRLAREEPGKASKTLII